MSNDYRQIVGEVMDLQQEDRDTTPGPALQWYPGQYLADAAIDLMSDAAQGIHMRLLMVAWKGLDFEESPIPCSLPDDETLLRSVCRRPDNWDDIWSEVKLGWRLYEGRYWNLGLCREYLKQMKTRRSRAAAANKRWMQEKPDDDAKRSSRDANASKPDANASKPDANASRLQCSSSSSPTPSSSPTSTAYSEEPREEKEAPTAPSADAPSVSPGEASQSKSGKGARETTADAKKSSADPSPSEELAAAQKLGDLISQGETRDLAAFIRADLGDGQDRKLEDYRGKKFDKEARRIERTALYAELYLRLRETDGDHPLDVLRHWRAGARSKARKKSGSNWCSDVIALQNLLTESDPVRLRAGLEKAAERTWVGFEWSHFDKSNSDGRGHRQSRAREESWRRGQELGVAAESGQVQPIDVKALLAALAEALPKELSGRDGLHRQILELEGDAEEIEQRLETIDREFLKAADEGLGPSGRERLEQELEAALSTLGRRLPAAELEGVRVQLRDRLLRDQLAFPRLSIFAARLDQAGSPDTGILHG